MNQSGRTRGDVTLTDGVATSVTLENVPTPILQALYREVTGKTEKITRIHKQACIIKYEDIVQLAYRVNQTLEQYDVLGKSELITITHVGDDKYTFSSMHRFSLYDTSKKSAISSTTFQFNFLLRSLTTDKHYNYRLSVRINPFVLEEVREESDEYLGPLSDFIGAPIFSEIEYVDYVVARNLLSAVDDWFNSVRRTEKTPIVDFLQKNGRNLIFILRVIGICAAFYAGLILMPQYRLNIRANFESISQWLLGSILWITLTFVIYFKTTPHNMLGWLSASKISFCIVNKGDESNKIETEKYVGSRRRWLIAGATTVLIQVLVSVSADHIRTMFGL